MPEIFNREPELGDNPEQEKFQELMAQSVREGCISAYSSWPGENVPNQKVHRPVHLETITDPRIEGPDSIYFLTNHNNLSFARESRGSNYQTYEILEKNGCDELINIHPVSGPGKKEFNLKDLTGPPEDAGKPVLGISYFIHPRDPMGDRTITDHTGRGTQFEATLFLPAELAKEVYHQIQEKPARIRELLSAFNQAIVNDSNLTKNGSEPFRFLDAIKLPDSDANVAILPMENKKEAYENGHKLKPEYIKTLYGNYSQPESLPQIDADVVLPKVGKIIKPNVVERVVVAQLEATAKNAETATPNNPQVAESVRKPEALSTEQQLANTTEQMEELKIDKKLASKSGGSRVERAAVAEIGRQITRLEKTIKDLKRQKKLEKSQAKLLANPPDSSSAEAETEPSSQVEINSSISDKPEDLLKDAQDLSRESEIQVQSQVEQQSKEEEIISEKPQERKLPGLEKLSTQYATIRDKRTKTASEMRYCLETAEKTCDYLNKHISANQKALALLDKGLEKSPQIGRDEAKLYEFAKVAYDKLKKEKEKEPGYGATPETDQKDWDSVISRMREVTELRLKMLEERWQKLDLLTDIDKFARSPETQASGGFKARAEEILKLKEKISVKEVEDKIKVKKEEEKRIIEEERKRERQILQLELGGVGLEIEAAVKNLGEGEERVTKEGEVKAMYKKAKKLVRLLTGGDLGEKVKKQAQIEVVARGGRIVSREDFYNPENMKKAEEEAKKEEHQRGVAGAWNFLSDGDRKKYGGPTNENFKNYLKNQQVKLNETLRRKGCGEIPEDTYYNFLMLGYNLGNVKIKGWLNKTISIPNRDGGGFGGSFDFFNSEIKKAKDQFDVFISEEAKRKMDVKFAAGNKRLTERSYGIAGRMIGQIFSSFGEK